MNVNEALFQFIGESPSPYHAIKAIEKRLTGYTLLKEQESWNLVPGGHYMVRRNGSSLIAFRVPEGDFTGFLLSAAHSDSPTFLVKGDTKNSDGYLRVAVEPYGGMIMSAWLDRPLSMAGRVAVKTEKGVKTCLLNIDRDLMVIPSVAIHMNREVNKGYAFNAKTDLLPLLGLDTEGGALVALIADTLSCEKEDILSFELNLYPRVKGATVGLQNEFIMMPRLDDLQCVFGCMEGFLQGKEQGTLPVLAVFDNEEVGSGTQQGAGGTFLADVLRRIAAALQKDYRALVGGSFMVSADNAHAVHPNHPEYADSLDRPKMNKGIVIKRSAARKYTSDAVSQGIFVEILKKAGVPVQQFTNRPDLPGGSTLGNISTSQVSLHAVDIGLAQLAMHSSVETAGALDTEYLVKGMTAFYSTPFRAESDESWTI